MTAEPPRTGKLGQAGAALWDRLTAELDFEGHELLILGEAARTADTCADLQRILDAEGPLDVSPHGKRAHPALVELRAQRLTLARLLVALRLPTGVEGETAPVAARDQRRGGIRGVYGVK